VEEGKQGDQVSGGRQASFAERQVVVHVDARLRSATGAGKIEEVRQSSVDGVGKGWKRRTNA
jgi:hypothetical protein